MILVQVKLVIFFKRGGEGVKGRRGVDNRDEEQTGNFI
jgi:hypothetical protein